MGEKKTLKNGWGWLVAEPGPILKICWSNWIISPKVRGEKGYSKIFELPPSRDGCASNDPFRIWGQFFRGELAVSF